MQGAENTGFLRAVIIHAANLYYVDQVVDTEMEEALVGPGLEWESKESWVECTIKEWFEDTAEKIIPVKEPEKQQVDHIRIEGLYSRCKLGERVMISKGLEIIGVIGGWIHIITEGGDSHSVFVSSGKHV